MHEESHPVSDCDVNRRVGFRQGGSEIGDVSPQGTYAQTRAFAVVTASGSTSIFSVDKALEAIAI
jgi:hypothetical protein